MKIYKILLLFTLTSLFMLSGCSPKASPEEIAFAKCITDEGAVMFGAYWCSHCKSQKKAFGESFSEINYIECSLPGGEGQTEICNQAKIESYPTWEFADGSRVNGEMSFGQLSAKTACKLP